MATTAQPLYPPAPPGIPADLARPTRRYRWLVAVMLLSLLAFAVVYLGLVLASGWLLYLAVTYPPGKTTLFTVGLKVTAVGLALLPFLFLLKGLFKTQRQDRALLAEVTPDGQPELFAFLEQLCRDTGAPRPYRVFVSPEVNAAVCYDASLLNLILPVRKNLVIGLGLVNALNLTEFKAVLAHEFGHFSQHSMKLGRYVYLTNRLLADLVYGRDAFDYWVARCRAVGGVIGGVGTAFAALLGLLRLALGGLFRGINLADAALSRQMEFQADLVAVSVTGSDALVHALARLEFAAESLTLALTGLHNARTHNRYSADLFFHQAQAGPHLRRLKKDAKYGLPPAVPLDPRQQVQVFKPDRAEVPSMYASHPANHLRERNAKRRYCRSHFDARSPWLLFRAADEVRARMTLKVYRQAFKAKGSPALEDPAKIQAFLDAEHRETTYDPKYHGLYDGRLIQPGDVDGAEQETARPWPDERIRAALATLQGRFGPEFQAFMKAHQQRREERELLEEVIAGGPAAQTRRLVFRKKRFEPEDAPRLLRKVVREMKGAFERFEAIDREVFQVHAQLARRLDRLPEFLARYRWHLELQRLLAQASDDQMRLEVAARVLTRQAKLDGGHFRAVIHHLDEVHASLKALLQRAKVVRLPPLKNVAAGQPLRPFLLKEPLVAERLAYHREGELTGEWIGKLAGQVAQVRDQIKRFHFKSLGGVLALQEELARAWQGQAAPANRPA